MMAGTVEIRNDMCWMSPGWVHDNVMDDVAEQLKAMDPVMSRRLRDARTYENGGYLDLRQDDPPTLLTLSRAAAEAYREVEKAGSCAFFDPTSYPAFLGYFKEFKDLLSRACRKDA